MHALLTTFLACPQCTYNRFMPSWYFFVLLRVLVVAMICRGRLDIVRVLGVLALLEVPFFFAWKIGVVWMYAERPGTDREQMAGIFETLFSSGILHGVFLLVLSRVPYFKVQDSSKIRVLRILCVVPAFIGVTFLHSMLAYSSFSSSIPR